jgi:long-chain acyl-CoA synthetase
MNEKTIPELLQNRVKEHGTRLLFQRRDGWSWKQITWLDFDRKVKNIASFMMNLGFGKGDKTLIVSSNRLEAISSEIGTFLLGGIVIPLPKETDAEEIVKTVHDYDAKFIFIEEGPVLEGALGSLDRIPNVERIAVFPDIKMSHDRLINFRALLKAGLMNRKKLQDELTEISSGIEPGNPAMLFVGSESSAREPRAVSQGGILEALSAMSDKYSALGDEDQSFSYLTDTSPFAKLVNYFTIYKANRAAVADTEKDFYMDVVEVMPTVLFETGAGIENMYKNSLSNLNGDSPEKKIRSVLGTRIKYIFTDRKPLPEIERLFREAGVSLVEVPELSEIGG